jgi:DNA polymerase kappa
LTEKIDRILGRKRQLEKLDLTSDIRRADEYINELEISRDLSQYIVHCDADAFYAAVEELDHPELKHVPMAVGVGVLTTCNYHARKFGCRSGMAGFVAMKLCPQLICLPLNFGKYTAVAQKVREVFAEYDPRFQSASLDEAYLNITEYCQRHEKGPVEVVEQMRAEVHVRSKITVSAGIAANAKLAKISSNRNKPNGQFHLANDRGAIMAFMRDLPTRKVNGIGRVFERELDAIGVKTCGDIYLYRGFMSKLFGEKAFQFLMTCYLGIGRTDIRPAEEIERKSVGTESTFRDMSDKNELRAKLRHIAEELEKDLIRTQFKGRTLVLKIKLHTYEVLTRQVQPPMAISKADDLYKYSLPMMAKLEKELPKFTLRLMGLRCTHLISTRKEGIDFFGMGKVSTTSRPTTPRPSSKDDEQWEVWPEAEFEEAARQERQDEMNEIEALSQVEKFDEHRYAHGKEVLPNPVPGVPPAELEEDQSWSCPICSRPQAADDKAFNEHIDLCLSRQTIEEAVKASSVTGETPTVRRESSVPEKSRKRGRPAKADTSDNDRAQKKLFFS